jgi:2'-5' RNA ligase
VRLFVAVWPPEAILDQFAALPRPVVASPQPGSGPILRWTTRDQWHVTLLFLGEVADGGLVDAVTSAIGELEGSGAVDALLGPATAWFPGRRVLQVPVSGLESLNERVRVALRPVGVLRNADRHESFHGHLTMARVRAKSRVRGPVADDLSGMPISATWRVTSLNLVSSTLHPQGSRYEDVIAVSL